MASPSRTSTASSQIHPIECHGGNTLASILCSIHHLTLPSPSELSDLVCGNWDIDKNCLNEIVGKCTGNKVFLADLSRIISILIVCLRHVDPNEVDKDKADAYAKKLEEFKTSKGL